MMRLTLRLYAALLVIVLGQPSFADDMASGLEDAQLAELGQHWTAAINAGDAAALNDMLDAVALARRSAATFSESKKERDDFVRGFTNGASRLAPMWISQVRAQKGRARFLRVHTFKGMRGPLLRYDLGNGYNYVLLIAEPRGAAPQVVDIFLATTGQRLSDSLGAVSVLLVAPNPGLLDRLFGVTRIDYGVATTFKELGQQQRAGRTADAYATLQKLPEAIRNQRVVLNIGVQLASQLGDEDIYRQELARLARRYKDDPTAAFTLIDYYFFEGDFKSAMEAVAGMERAFGNDAAIAMMKANIAMTGGDLAAARRYAQQAVDLEPDNEDGRWTLVTSLMRAEDYAAGIQVLESLERDFGYHFDPARFAGNEVYAGFVQSPEYAAWRDAR